MELSRERSLRGASRDCLYSRPAELEKLTAVGVQMMTPVDLARATTEAAAGAVEAVVVALLELA